MRYSQMMERVFGFELFSYVVAVVVIVTLYMLSSYLKVVALCFKLPGPRAWPIIGNVLLATDKRMLQKYGNDGFKEFGTVFRVWLSFLPVVVVLAPEHVQLILSSKKHTDKIFFYKLLHNFLGNGLITSSGVKWSSHRKLIQPSFHINILDQFVNTFTESAQCLIAKLHQAPKILNITPFINNCVLDILNDAVLGVPVQLVKTDNNNDETSPFRKGDAPQAQYRITRPWLLFNWVYKLTDAAASEVKQKNALFDFTRNMIAKRRNEKKKGVERQRKSLLEYMIEMGDSHPEFTEDDIINEACTFMLAGQDSVAAGVAFCLFVLAQHPQHQAKVIEEIDSIFSDKETPPSMQDLREMRYLEQCIKETLRLYPSVPLIARKISEDIVLDKCTLPAGCEVFISPFSTHRLPHIYPEPEKFDPDRFLAENTEKRHAYAYIPFSAGPRNCIGHKFAILEMKTVISTILRHYTLTPVAGKETVDPMYRITLRARGGLWVTLNPRDQTN